MGNYLMKTPITAILFASVLSFSHTFLMPLLSQDYSASLAEFSMPLMGRVFMIAYGLWLSIILAVIFSSAHDKGVKLVIFLVTPVIFTQWLVPFLRQLQFHETTGVMSRLDTVMEGANGGIATAILLTLALLLFKTAPPPPPVGKPVPPKPQDKYKIKKLNLAIKLLVLPVIYCVIYFLAWYFLLWRFESARVYYTGSTDTSTFIGEMINMLLTNPTLVLMALVEGLLYALCVFTLLIQLLAKRAIFIAATVMLFMGPALRMLIPSPVMPGDVQFAHMIEYAAIALVYGALSAFMLHTSVHKEAAVQPAAPPARKPRPTAEPQQNAAPTA